MNNNKWILFHLLYKDLLGGFVVKKVAIQINPEEIEYEYFHEEDVQNKIRELIKERELLRPKGWSFSLHPRHKWRGLQAWSLIKILVYHLIFLILWIMKK